MSRWVTSRTAERLHRAAYDFEYLANTLKVEGFESIGGGVRDVSNQLGKLARRLDEELEKKRK
jgi:hypothetical protein